MTPAGDTCRVAYDWRGEGPAPAPGDGLASPSGRRYLIVSARRVRSVASPNRWAFGLLVLGPEDPDPDRVFDLLWNRRSKRAT